jgi:hypothetical protein
MLETVPPDRRTATCVTRYPMRKRTAFGLFLGENLPFRDRFQHLGVRDGHRLDRERVLVEDDMSASLPTNRQARALIISP